MFQGIEHLAIAARDPFALAEFYRTVLDFSILNEEAGGCLLQAQDGSVLELITADPAASKEAAIPAMRTAGLRHFAIAVTDFDSAFQRLEQHGVSVEGKPYWNGGNRIVFFRDPEGTLLHLIQREKPLR